jgi:3-oxoacyl-[acyl-carrier-protein] synthase-3
MEQGPSSMNAGFPSLGVSPRRTPDPMTQAKTAAITAVAGFLPDYVLGNAELERLVETNDEWIRTRTGISERRIQKGEGLGTSDMVAPAVTRLLTKRGIGPEEIDCLIVGTVTPDMCFPSTANLSCLKAGLKNAWGYDLAAACSGFLYALITGASLIESGRCKKVIVAGADKMSSIIDYTDRNTCVLFGDGAACVLLEQSEDDSGVKDAILRSDGAGGQFLRVPASGSQRPASHATVDARDHYLHQEGQQVFKAAVRGMADVAYDLLTRNNLKGEDITWLVPHQANQRIIDATANRIGIAKDRVMVNIERYGNTTGATLPLCLMDWESRLKRGDNLILAAFGAGFTWGAAWIKWAYDGAGIAAVPAMP